MNAKIGESQHHLIKGPLGLKLYVLEVPAALPFIFSCRLF
jgi:hypothetical protein